MKKILLILSLIFVLFSCNTKDVEDVRQVKIGMSINELKYVMGKPFAIDIQPNVENWYFTYFSDGYKQGLRVDIQNGKVVDFYSY